MGQGCAAAGAKHLDQTAAAQGEEIAEEPTQQNSGERCYPEEPAAYLYVAL